MNLWWYDFPNLNFTDCKKCEEGCNAKNDWHIGLSEAGLQEKFLESANKRDTGWITLRRRGGMKVKATQAAISRPATTALIAKSRGIVRICIFISSSLVLVVFFSKSLQELSYILWYCTYNSCFPNECTVSCKLSIINNSNLWFWMIFRDFTLLSRSLIPKQILGFCSRS